MAITTRTRECCKWACHPACLSWQERAENCCFRKKWWQGGGWPETVSLEMFSITGDRKPHQTDISMLDSGRAAFSGMFSGLTVCISQPSARLHSQVCSPSRGKKAAGSGANCVLASSRLGNSTRKEHVSPSGSGRSPRGNPTGSDCFVMTRRCWRAWGSERSELSPTPTAGGPTWTKSGSFLGKE